MIRELIAYPFVSLLSRLVGLVGLIGIIVGRFSVFSWLFDWLIGFEKAERRRDEHEQALVNAVAAYEIDYQVSKQELIEEIRENHRKSISQIARGESVLSVTIALIAVLIDELPGTIEIVLGITLPLPTVNTILLILTILLVASVAFKQIAIEAQAFSSPTVFDSYDALMTKLAWNQTTLRSTRTPTNLLAFEIWRQIDERFYQLYLEMFADVVREGGISKIEGLSRYGREAIEIAEDKFVQSAPNGDASE